MSIKDKLQTHSIWSIVSLKPKSERFSQLSFEGFTPKGKNIFTKLGKAVADFLIFLFKYFRRKLRLVLGVFISGMVQIYSYVLITKAYITRKLIWSRGKLARPIATSIIMSTAFGVFMFGEILSGSRFVNSQEINPDYLSNVTDIIPQRNTAITTIPESRKRNEAIEYTIQQGDTLSSIGNEYKISIDALQYVNGLSDSAVLKVGQTIIIPPVAGLIHKIERGDTLNSIAAKYDVAPQAIADFNYILDVSKLALGTELVIPGAKVPEPVLPVLPSTPNQPGTRGPLVDASATKGFCAWPSSVRIITQSFSWYHNGIDVATPAGQAMPPIYACNSGTVVRAGWDPFGLGLHIRIDHGNGYETVYGHMSRIDVGYGESVSKGASLGLMGNTGNSTGPHVHFMVRYQGVAQNPLNYTN